MNPSLAKLRQRPNPRYNPIWPQGTKQPLTKELADYFFCLLSTCDSSLLELLRRHPELPHFNQLDNWRRRRPWFAEAWKQARQYQADFLAQKCLELAKSATPQTAHVIRVQFDVLKWLCAKFHPAAYAEKPATAPIQNVNVGVAISPQRLQDIRSKLEQTRSAFSNPSASASRLNSSGEGP